MHALLVVALRLSAVGRLVKLRSHDRNEYSYWGSGVTGRLSF